MWLDRTVCAMLTAVAMTLELSDLGSTTGDESPREGSAGLSLEQLDLRSHHHHHHRCKQHNSNKKQHKKKPVVSVKTYRGIYGDATGPMTSKAGAVRENFEDLSRISSLSPNFWVRTNLPNRTADPKWKKGSDCFYKSRTKMRHYPSTPGHSCYSRNFTDRMTAWWNFWPEIRGDLQYAFDFVMWDEYEPYHETNTFWYLMLYLKTLVSRISDPNDIMPRDPSARRPRTDKPFLNTKLSNNNLSNKMLSIPTERTQIPYLEELKEPGGDPDPNTRNANSPGGQPYSSAEAPADLDYASLFELLKEYQLKLDHLEYLLN